MSGDIYGCRTGVGAGATGIQWAEAGDTAQHPKCTGQPPTKSSPAQMAIPVPRMRNPGPRPLLLELSSKSSLSLVLRITLVIQGEKVLTTLEFFL